MRLLKMSGVMLWRGLSRSKIYQEISQGLFPRPVKMGGYSAVWPEHEVEEINRAWVAGKSEDEIRELVNELVAKRKQA